MKIDDIAEITVHACEVFERRHAIYAEYLRRIGDPDRVLTDLDKRAAIFDYFHNRKEYNENL